MALSGCWANTCGASAIISPMTVMANDRKTDMRSSINGRLSRSSAYSTLYGASQSVSSWAGDQRRVVKTEVGVSERGKPLNAFLTPVHVSDRLRLIYYATLRAKTSTSGSCTGRTNGRNMQVCTGIERHRPPPRTQWKSTASARCSMCGRSKRMDAQILRYGSTTVPANGLGRWVLPHNAPRRGRRSRTPFYPAASSRVRDSELGAKATRCRPPTARRS